MIASCSRPVSVIFSKSISEILILSGGPGPCFLVPRVSRHHVTRDDCDVRFFLRKDIPYKSYISEIIRFILSEVDVCELDHFEFSIFIEF
jgi:hypothetical protein